MEITVGMKINNSAFGKYGKFIAVYDNPKQHRTMLMCTNPSVQNLYIGAWYLQKRENEDGWCWSQGHYYRHDFEAATNYVLGKDK